MFLGYLDHRRELGFATLRDIEDGHNLQQFFHMKKINIPVNWIVPRGRQTFVRKNEKNVSYEIELVNKTVYFLKGILHKTYKFTRVIYKCGVVQKIAVSFAIFVFALELRFGSCRPVESIIPPQTHVERQLQHSNSTQADQKGLNFSGGDQSKFRPSSRAKADARWVSKTNRVLSSIDKGQNFIKNCFLRITGGFQNPFQSQNRPDSTRSLSKSKSHPSNFSIKDRLLKPHEIDKTIFENDKRLKKDYHDLVKFNKSLEKDFQPLEEKITQGYF
jgi:hypothetical protein